MPIIMPAKGREITAKRVKGDGTEPRYVHWGTGTAAPADNNTGLQSPRNEARVAGTSSIVTTTTANDTYRVIGTLTASGVVAITEAGLFDSAGSGTPPTGGNLFIRGTFAALNLEAGDSIQFTIDAVYQAP